LPWDIVGLFQLFIFDQKKKVISVLDPLPARDLGKNILKAMGKTLNLAFQVAHPESKDDIYRWGYRVPIVPTDADVYESCQDITILLIYSLHNIHFVIAGLCQVIWFSISCIHGMMERYFIRYLG
jgi:hypothetical protein